MANNHRQTSHTLTRMIEAARKIKPTQGEIEIQRRSFAYGNTHLQNALITRQMVNHIADEMPFSGDVYRLTK